ncbi:MAG: MTAP family purine nucleoside phosphorylase [Nitrospinae bacterium]|nr:MTAP family purine nucleoside phosphorylase [Nitrospinota bacterium]
MSFKSKLAIIGGSRSYDLLRENKLGEEVESKIVETPFGQSAPIHFFQDDSIEYLFMSRHGEERYSTAAPFVNYRANIWGLKELGVERIISWSGPGIINDRYRVGEIAIPSDLIDETKNRLNTFFEKRGLGFIRQSEPFCPIIREALNGSLANLGINHRKEGVYLCTEGPRLETPAEITKYKIIGGDLVGMTLIPEVFLARELEICYASICYLTNYAEGVRDRRYKGGKLFEGIQDEEEHAAVEAALCNIPRIIKEAISILNDIDRDCLCKDAMLRYKKNGVIDNNWRDWIKG